MSDLLRPRPSSTRYRILQMIARGLTNSQIGTRLPMSTQGVSYHVGELLKEFRVSSRTALVAKAYAHGYLEAWPPRFRGETPRFGGGHGPVFGRYPSAPSDTIAGHPA